MRSSLGSSGGRRGVGAARRPEGTCFGILHRSGNKGRFLPGRRSLGSRTRDADPLGTSNMCFFASIGVGGTNRHPTPSSQHPFRRENSSDRNEGRSKSPSEMGAPGSALDERRCNQRHCCEEVGGSCGGPWRQCSRALSAQFGATLPATLALGDWPLQSDPPDRHLGVGQKWARTQKMWNA